MDKNYNSSNGRPISARRFKRGTWKLKTADIRNVRKVSSTYSKSSKFRRNL
jgi:hypothetical protein